MSGAEKKIVTTKLQIQHAEALKKIPSLKWLFGLGVLSCCGGIAVLICLECHAIPTQVYSEHLFFAIGMSALVIGFLIATSCFDALWLQNLDQKRLDLEQFHQEERLHLATGNTKLKALGHATFNDMHAFLDGYQDILLVVAHDKNDADDPLAPEIVDLDEKDRDLFEAMSLSLKRCGEICGMMENMDSEFNHSSMKALSSKVLPLQQLSQNLDTVIKKHKEVLPWHRAKKDWMPLFYQKYALLCNL